MANSDAVDNIFAVADTNRDGRIDKNELSSLISKGEGVTFSTWQASSAGDDLNNNTDRYARYRHRETTTVTSDLANEMPIKSGSVEETNRYLRSLGSSVYVDSNPQIIRRPTFERPVTYEQRIMLRCLQPPPLTSVEPLIVKEVRPEQPPPPPPLVIREHGSCTSQPPPLILRERPPVPPARIPGETVIRHLPSVPLPPRSVQIERFSDCPEKPRDIIIERWLPYAAGTERREIVEHAPPPLKYPAPTHTVIIYDSVQPVINQKIERLGITQEDPEAYVARYGAALLDRDTLLQRARDAGIVQDISCSSLASSGSSSRRANFIDVDKSNDAITQGFSLSGRNSYGGTQRVSNTPVTNLDIRNSSSSLQGHGFSTETGSAREIRSGYHVDDADVNTTTTVDRDGETTVKETYRYF
ncbi:unnamed protein product [Rotaria sp. Silwood2]|nr:unnamed protein product [Rotaria sp. Silwood2]CAF2809344.1 unnamed protein product [Rotaria sp. Silwood2]CAF3362259.1 unnamed protein product [Rotaria sp. Silwood2]CAF4246546.1 unnamed protein product [Rotaria sp. Silwood2]CAF4264254.1 unnamed protein product [Rotaria sp. Silwood2]